MNLKKHTIVKVIQSVVNLLVQLIALVIDEINSNNPLLSEIPSPNSFSYWA